MARCIEQTNKPYGDPAGYCFHHFCPFKCDWIRSFSAIRFNLHKSISHLKNASNVLRLSAWSFEATSKHFLDKAWTYLIQNPFNTFRQQAATHPSILDLS
jgi:hypothetical protein